MVNKKRRLLTILIVVAMIIVLCLLAYFVIKGLPSSTGKVVDNDGITYSVIANDDRVTMPAKAADTNPDLSSYN